MRLVTDLRYASERYLSISFVLSIRIIVICCPETGRVRSAGALRIACATTIGELRGIDCRSTQLYDMGNG